jgi:hypothetical protein
VIVGVIGLVSTAILVVGLIVLDKNRQAGSWMIAIGSVPTLLTLVALNPVGLLAAATITGGLWTGNLAFTSRPTEIDANDPAVHSTSPAGTRWQWWIVTAIALFAFGLGVLMFFEGIAMSERAEGLLYFTWLMSWAAAAATGTIGIALVTMRIVSRHRTRTA